MSQKICWIFGATGLIGHHFMQKACENDHYQTIHVFSRRKIQFSHPKLNVHIIDFRQLESALAQLEGATTALSFGSGMAAITAALRAVLRTGSVVVVPADGYYQVRRFADIVADVAAA